MPPRKSNVSVVTNGEAGEVATPTGNAKSRDQNGLSVEELNLPRTMVQRLAKGVLPSNTQIQRDALLAISKSATVFVNFLASQAGENTAASGKKTIMPHDVYAALKENEFDFFIDRVKEETIKYNEIQCDKRNTYRRTKAAEKKAADIGGATNGEAMDEDGQMKVNGTNGTAEEDGERPAKKLRREDGDEGDDGEDDEPDMFEPDDDIVDEEDSAEEEVEEEIEEDEPDDGDEGLADEETKANGIRDEALDEPDSD
ncbi:hypothetical protein KVT40_005809 [Elsinoe batatas]|uniref:DNA polymerase epsilon subunit D n=1 Tax=Elsinoe batatas TaxID=2601811 RepID=A0A8K0PIP8_9PEZI|nr:hypothetical protein KVT40_005809 [Elsinoe batatas]